MVEGCAVGERRPVQRRGEPAASRAGWTTTPARSSRSTWRATSSSSRSAAAAGTTRSPRDGRTTYPGVGISFGVSRTLVPLLSRRCARRQPGGALAPCSWRCPTRRPDRSATRSPSSCARAACPPRWPPRRRSSASRSATPSGAASRSCGSRRRRERRRHRPPGQGHPQRRPGARGPGHLAAPRRGPRPRRPHPAVPRQGAALVIRTHDAGSLRADARRRDRHPGRLGRPPARPRRRRLPRPPRGHGVVQVVVRDEEVAHHLRSEYCLKVTGEVAERPEGNANPHLPTGEIEVIAADVEVLSAAAPLPFPIDEHVAGGGGGAAQAPLPRPAALGSRRRRCGCAARSTEAAREVLDAHGFVEVETPTLTRSTPEGARDFLVPARLQPGQLVRPAAEPAAVQAAADGRRHGALLPDRALLPRRGLPRRPAAGVHPARHRDELRRAGRRASRWPRTILARAVGADRRTRSTTPIPRMTLRRGDAPLRHRQARPADGPRARRVHRRTSPTPRSGCSRRRTSARWSCPAARPAAQAARRLAGVGQAARRAGAGLRARR